MKNKPFTIQTYFPNESTRSIRISQIPTRTIQSILIPRDELKKAISSWEELKYNGVYFLFEEEGYFQSNGESSVYIGESEDITECLSNHARNKEKWTIAIVFINNSKTNQLNKADIKYLENYCYQKALEANRYMVKQNIPKQSYVSEARKADLEDLFQSILTLLTFAGYPLFTPIISSESISDEEDIFYLSQRLSKAKGIYSEDGMTVLKDSIISSLDSNKGFKREKLLKNLIDSQIIDKEGEFTTDYTFTAPSTAADIVCKGSYNGWKVWKNKQGKSLDEVTERNS